MNKLYSMLDIYKLFDITPGRINYLFQTRLIDRPKNHGSKINPEYHITKVFIASVKKANKIKNIRKKISYNPGGSQKSAGSNGAGWSAAVEKRLKDFE